MARPGSAAKAGFYPTPPLALKEITERLNAHVTFGTTPEKDEYRIFDPCCGTGEPLAAIHKSLTSRDLPPVRSFGIELSSERAAQAAGMLTETMNADLFSTSIGHESFSLMLLNPPYDTTDTEDETTGRAEREFLTRCTPYLARQAGILVLIVQRKFLNARNSRFLAGHYREIGVIPFPEGEREQFDQIIVFGVKKTHPYNEAQVEKSILEWDGETPLEPQEGGTWRVMALRKKEIYLNPSTWDPRTAADEASRSGLWTNPEVTNLLWPEETARTKPLMPLREGHIALLTAGGFLDNTVLEDDAGERFLVKGNVEKKEVETEYDDDHRTVQERLQISIIALDLKSGDFMDIKP